MEVLDETGFKIYITKKMRPTLTQWKVRQTIDRATAVLEADIRRSRRYLLPKMESWVEFNPYGRWWEVGIAIDCMKKAGWGRKGKLFMEKQEKSLSEVIPMIRRTIKKELKKLIIKGGKNNEDRKDV